MLRSRPLRFAAWFAAVTSSSAPFLLAYHTFPLPTFYNEVSAAGLWILLALAVLTLTWRGQAQFPAIVLAPLGLVAALALQLQIAPPLNAFYSLAAMCCLLGAAVACGLGARCREVPGLVEALAVGCILGGLATIAIEYVQVFRVQGLSPTYISVIPLTNDRRMWGNLNQANHVASYLAFGLAACLFLAQKNKSWRVPLTCIVPLFMLGMIVTFSRTTWLHIIAIGALAGLVCTSGESGRRRLWLASVRLLALVAAFQVCSWAVDCANAFWHLGFPVSLNERMQTGSPTRLLLWRHAWHMFLAHPWLGGGWGDYAWNQYVQTDTLGPVIFSMHAHNIFLDLLAKVGIVGTMAVAFSFLGLVRVVWRNRVVPELAFLYAIVLVMGIHSMVEYPLHYLYFLLPFSFALGYADNRVLRLPSPGMAKLLSVAVVICGTALLGHLWGDYKAVERLSYSPESFDKELVRYRQHGTTLLAPFGTLAIAMHWNVVPAMAPALVVLERQAVEFYPDSNTVQRYALALAYLGRTDEAVIQVRRLRNMFEEDYPKLSSLLVDTCKKRDWNDALLRFCSHLASENLVAGFDLGQL
ncbi:O-antigen ligase C-terminal domain-containing protein [Ralstonia pickettii]|uniref:O-antigen ligase C-terminal domain-containing protein n=2 Tax=Burkholderiaceae TaxID=119060 RepID=A0A9Q3LRM7_RALPI|nr:polymerase [Ralstonia pickettii]MBA9852281.1 polymerase [Ralstonia pickettii]MBA9878747.1 polymerase [Ralstonia pickettii]MBA9881980.1 polymerase [Ralstonia pickettii]MBA9888823.1 polymerase [Ralstonia pickettii]